MLNREQNWEQKREKCGNVKTQGNFGTPWETLVMGEFFLIYSVTN